MQILYLQLKDLVPFQRNLFVSLFRTAPVARILTGRHGSFTSLKIE